MPRFGKGHRGLLYNMYFLRFFARRKRVFGYDNKACENWASLENFTREKRRLLDEENLIFHAPLLSTELEKGGEDVWRWGENSPKAHNSIAPLESMTHLRHVLLVKGECDVGTAVVLVREAGVAFGGWRGCWRPAFSKAKAGFDKAVFFLDGNARLADGARTSALSCATWLWSTPHLNKTTKVCFWTLLKVKKSPYIFIKIIIIQINYHGAMNPSVLTLADIAVLFPFGAISGYLSINITGSANDCKQHKMWDYNTARKDFGFLSWKMTSKEFQCCLVQNPAWRS